MLRQSYALGFWSSLLVAGFGTSKYAIGQMYVITDLGVGEAYAINNSGQVVGSLEDRAFLVTPEDTNLDGVPDRWYRDSNSDGVNDLMTELGVLPGGQENCALDINDAGQIVGWSETTCSPLDPPWCGSTKRVAVYWADGNTAPIPLSSILGFIQTGEGTAYGLNDEDPPTVVGSAEIPGLGWVYPAIWRYNTTLAQWIPGALISPGVLGSARDINTAGEVVGHALSFTGQLNFHLHQWNGPFFLPPWDLGTLGCEYCWDPPGVPCAACPQESGWKSFAAAINEHSQVVGYSYAADPKFRESFLYEDGGLPNIAQAGEKTNLGTLPTVVYVAYRNCEAADINDCGQVVGESTTRAFLWVGDPIVDLNDLTGEDSPWHVRRADGVNNLGQIVGFGDTEGDSMHVRHALVLNPSLDIVDPNPDLLSGADVDSDKDVLGAGAARQVTGLAADGVTRILLRLPVSGQGGHVVFTVEDELGSMNTEHVGRLTDRQGNSDSTTVAQLDVDVEELGNGRQMAFAILHAPDDFVRFGTSEEDNDRCRTQRPLTVTATYTPGVGSECGAPLTAERDIELHRTPIMMIHGIWGKQETWGWCFADPNEDDHPDCDPPDCNALRDAVYNHEYVSSHAQSFRVNLVEPRAGVAAAVNKLRDRDIAATQVDVFAHSMGGILCRLHAADFNGCYYRDDTFGMGDFHKLITVDSPHEGSPWGCVLLRTDGERNLLGDIANATGKFRCPECGGLYDMRPEDIAFASSIEDILISNGYTPARLPPVSLPVAIMTGTGGSDFLDNSPANCGPLTGVVLLLRNAMRGFCAFLCGTSLCGPLCDPALWFEAMFDADDSTQAECGTNPDHPLPCHDVAVTMTSQLGGLDASDFVENRFDCLDGIHFSPGVPGCTSAAARAIELLNAPTDGGLFALGFPEATPEGCGLVSDQHRAGGKVAPESPGNKRGLIHIISPTPPPSPPDTFAPGDTITVQVEPVAPYTPEHVLAISSEFAEWVDCGSCGLAELALSVPMDEVGMLTLGAFAYEDISDVEGTSAQATPVRVKIIPNASASVKGIGVAPSQIFLFEYAPMRRISVYGQYDDDGNGTIDVTREFSGCRVPACCDATCANFESEECDEFVQDISYVTTDPTVASVDCQGYVTAHSIGRTTVTVAYNAQTYGPCTDPSPNSPCKATVEVVVISVPCDFDGDGEVGLADFRAFVDCASGGPTPTCLYFYDYDEDGDVDSDDFPIFLECYAGPECDCNTNGIVDLEDIFTGSSLDADHNGIPDDCEETVVGLNLVQNGDFASGDFDPWTTEVIPPGRVDFTIENTDCFQDVLRLQGSLFSDAIVSQDIGVAGLEQAQSIALVLDVRVDAQSALADVYPANVWVDYEDPSGGFHTFQRSFYVSNEPDQFPVPPVHEEISLATWVHRSYELSSLMPPVSRIVEVRLSGQGSSYDTSFDNVMLVVDGVDCNSNGVPDGVDIAGGTSGDCNSNGTPDDCEFFRLYVRADAAGANDGSSWTDAYNHLQDALVDPVSSGGVGEIWTTVGTYRPDENAANPTGDGDRYASFQLKNCVAIYGGFNGTETSLEERDLLSNRTILSGDLNEDDAVAGDAENSLHVVFAPNGIDPSAVMDGFTITAGNATISVSSHDRGAGILTLSASPTVRNCVLVGNRANEGGAISSGNGSNPTVVNCAIGGNTAVSQGGGFLSDDSSGTLINCTFYENTADDRGGGAFIVNNSSVTIANCTFWQNSDAGGPDESGQIHIIASTVAVDYCCVQGLTGALGGFGNIGGDPQFVDADGVDDVPGTTDDDLRLTHGSPCIDAADSTVVPSTITRDLLGNPRMITDPTTADTGNGVPPIVDMGAIEYLPDCNGNSLFDGQDIAAGTSQDLNLSGVPDECETPGDFDGDGDVDLDDFIPFATCLTGPDAGPYGAGCEPFDFEPDGDADLADFAILQENFAGPNGL